VDEGEPNSYLAIGNETPALGSSGAPFGKVVHPLPVPEPDEFDGIVVDTKDGHQIVDRDQIREITTACVRCNLSDDEAAVLPTMGDEIPSRRRLTCETPKRFARTPHE
jgi:hypothetical protein